MQEVYDTVNPVFTTWLLSHYASLASIPPGNPAMLHHIPRFLARSYKPDSRIALIVVDGLALDQWKTVKEQLMTQNFNFHIDEHAVFAWIPTLTSVSRQAIFSGKLPMLFPISIHTTNNKETLWKNFWENEHNISPSNVVYQRNLKDGNVAALLDRTINANSTIVGLVVNMVDNIMHGMQLGSGGMHNQIRQWCDGGFLGTLIASLMERNYEVYLTADHGNTECKGIGRIAEGVIPDTKGERVRVYPSAELRSRTSRAFPDAYQWEQIGLPCGYFPLIAKDKTAFVTQGETIVAHGGISLEEVIVPFVKFGRSNDIFVGEVKNE